MAENEATFLLKIKQTGQEILDHFVFTIGDVINLVKKLPAFIMDTVNAYRDEQRAIDNLTQSMINSGVFTADLRAESLRLALAFQQVTTYSDDQIISSQAILQSYLKGTAITKELLQATLDLAAGKKIDLATAANLVGKTIGTETDALKRQGVVVEETIGINNKMAATISAIDAKFRNSAANAAKDIGVIDQLKNSWGNFLQNTGSLFAPFVTSMARATKGTLDFINSLSGIDPKKMSGAEIIAEIKKQEEAIERLDNKIKAGWSLRDGASKNDLENQKVRLQQLKDFHAENLRMESEAQTNKSILDQASSQESLVLKMTKDQELFQYETDKNLLELSNKDGHELALIALEIQYADQRYNKALTDGERIAILKDKQALLNKQRGLKGASSDKEINDKVLKDRDAFLSQMSSLQSSSNSVLATIGKASAIAAIKISTEKSAASGREWGTAMGGPALGQTFAALAYVAGAAQVARIAGVQLADGGIVRASPGGTLATIGEGGRDEAVIPLENGMIPGGGGGSTFIFNGPVMGDEGQAMDFARAIDRSLLKLRQSNQSVSFDESIF